MIPPKLKPAVYRLAHVLKPVLPYGILANFAQWATGYAHEQDFEIFDGLADMHDLVLDVGASRGQSALSVLRRTRRIRVLSVEPNSKHRWSLFFIVLLHPVRFRYRMIAAGMAVGVEVLHVPGKRASGLSTQGSLDPSEFEKDYVIDRLAAAGFNANDKTAYRRVAVQVLPLDQLKLSPGLIKLDVEGFESQALLGLEKTIKNHLPVLLIEVNNAPRWLPWLGGLGYEFYRYDPGLKHLFPIENVSRVLNLFCIHKRSPGALSQALTQKIKSNSVDS
jgi:FkbM family methyltransferase